MDRWGNWFQVLYAVTCQVGSNHQLPYPITVGADVLSLKPLLLEPCELCLWQPQFPIDTADDEPQRMCLWTRGTASFLFVCLFSFSKTACCSITILFAEPNSSGMKVAIESTEKSLFTLSHLVWQHKQNTLRQNHWLIVPFLLSYCTKIRCHGAQWDCGLVSSQSPGHKQKAYMFLGIERLWVNV